MVEGPKRITELPHLLSMTAQGASKLVIEMEHLGYLSRRSDPSDQRSRFVALTEHGQAVIAAGRTARATITTDLRSVLGEPAADQLIDALQRLAEHTGGLRELLARRLRPGR